MCGEGKGGGRRMTRSDKVKYQDPQNLQYLSYLSCHTKGYSYYNSGSQKRVEK